MEPVRAALTLLLSCRTATSKRMYSAAAFRVSTLLGFRSGLISGTMRFRRENMVFRFLIYRKGAEASETQVAYYMSYKTKAAPAQRALTLLSECWSLE